MTKDPAFWAIVIACGIVIAWVGIQGLYHGSRQFRRATRGIKCWCGAHSPTGIFEPAFGGREVQRCLYCDVIVYEVTVTKDQLRRRAK